MRCYTHQHHFSCGIDLHARTMVPLPPQPGWRDPAASPMPAGPAPFLKAVAPYREELVVCVECLLTWSWLADLWAHAGLSFVLGPALSRNASHGGQAKHDTIDAQTIAVLRRGGLLPQAYV